MGWLTVAAYAAAALVCWAAARRCPATPGVGHNARLRRMWTGVALLMFFLCINKQLDLQSLFTQIGRVIAERGGWYEARRAVQFWFVIAVAVAGIMAFAIIAWRTGSVLRERKLLLFGLSFLITFIIVRAASFHHVGAVFESEVLGVRVNWVLELGGIGMVLISAIRAILRP